MPKRYILAAIYFAPLDCHRSSSSCCRRRPAATLIFGAVIGLLWLSTIPPTSGLVAIMFGTRWLTMLFGFAFFSHQVGGFLGVWLGGVLFERPAPTTSIWWGSVSSASLSAMINLPIVEKPVARPPPRRRTSQSRGMFSTMI